MAPPAERSSGLAARRYVVRGRVQGVGYRAFVWRNAAQLGISGWVRNRRDGTVEVLASGDPDALAALERALETGPRWARVDGIEVETVPPGEAGPGFEIRSTSV